MSGPYSSIDNLLANQIEKINMATGFVIKKENMGLHLHSDTRQHADNLRVLMRKASPFYGGV